MARKFLTPIDLSKLELQNARIQNLATDPNSPVEGQIYYNTAHHELRVYDGTQWEPVGGSIEYGNTAGRPAAGNAGRVYADTQAGTVYVDDGTLWKQVAEFTGAVSAHNSNSSGVHGVTGSVVGTTDTQTLSSKTLSAPTLKGTISLTDSSDVATGSIAYSGGDTTLNATGALTISATDGGITLTPKSGTDVSINGSETVKSTLNVGGVDSTDGKLTVKAGDETAIFDVDGATSTSAFRGTFEGYTGLTKFFEITADGGNAAVISGYDSDLVLTSDTNNVYLNSNGSEGYKLVDKAYVDGLVSGLTWKPAANLLADTNVALTGNSGDLVIDNHAALGDADDGYRILLTGQSTASQNGIYVYSDDGVTYTLSRPADADTYEELKGAAIFIEEGDVYGATSWLQSNHYLTSFSGQVWTQFSGQGTYTAGDGIAIGGQEISVNNDSTLKFTTGALGVNFGDGINTNMAGAIQVHLGTGLTFDTGAITFASGYGVRKYSVTIGNNSNTSFTVTHNLGTKDLTVTVYDTTTDAEVFTDVVHTTNDTITVSFASAPATDAYRVVVVG